MRIEIDSSHPRLDRFLSEHLPEVPRNKWDDWIREGRVLLNGAVPSKGGQKLKAGDVLDTELPEMKPPARHLNAEIIDLPTLFEDAQLWIVDKPSGMVVHPGPGHTGGTVVNALLGRLQQKLPTGDLPLPADEIENSENDEEEQPTRGWPGLVHRLDRYTSGCLCLTKTMEAQYSLQGQFKERGVEKRYLALVRHSPKLPQLGSLLIDQPIARHRTDRIRMTIAAAGRPSQTRIRIISRTPSVALVECELLTGRTHQIRAHLQHLRAPLLGDGLYGGPMRWQDTDKQPLELPHPFLHAWKLAVDHPLSGERIAVEAPIPDEFRELAERLGLTLPD